MPEPSDASGRPRIGRRLGALIATALVIVTLGACSAESADQASTASSSTTAPPEPQAGGLLVVATSGEPDGMNPIASQWNGPAHQMARAVLDPLVVMDAEGQWHPYLAEAITPNTDFTEWTIQLRPGVMFHNGEALDATALVTFLEAIVNSPLTSQGFPTTPVIAATGDLTVTLTFPEPWSAMPTVLADQPGYVIAPAQVASGDTTEPIGTGPFVFGEWVKGERFRASRNPDYWRTGLPYLDSIEFRPITDPDARESTLRSGGVDMIELPAPMQSTLDDLAASDYRVIDEVDEAGVTNLVMNTSRGALQDRTVREAIVKAIDREEYRNVVLDESYEVADQPYPSDSPWHADVEYPTYEPDRAREAIEQYEAANGPVTITILLVAGSSAAGPQFIDQQLDAIGVDAQIEELEVTAFTRRYVTGDFDTALVGGFFSAADPDAITTFLTSENADPSSPLKLNFAQFRSDEIDAAMAAQRRTDDPDARRAEWAKVWSTLAGEVPYAFLAYQRYAFATDPDVYGLTEFTTPDGTVLPAINHWTPFYTAVHLAGR